MEPSEDHEREVRAARNQALFRAVNEKLEGLNEAFEAVTETFTVACECAGRDCLEMIEIRPDAYHVVREHPRRFVVCRGHVIPEVERTVADSDGYSVVEKHGHGGKLAAALAEPGRREDSSS